jgi:hypothetical protein
LPVRPGPRKANCCWSRPKAKKAIAGHDIGLDLGVKQSRFASTPERGQLLANTERDAVASRIKSTEDPNNRTGFIGKRSAPLSPALGCFVRDYDKSHLASHPNQLITYVRLGIRNLEGVPSYQYEFALQVQNQRKNQGSKNRWHV